ncbi:hypothetical protein [Staphylothermus marinus]|uniref:hypothetical protein n=1 Tax=Staphylothermus marinus TaxID=2280 RepID=UPI00069B5A74|nr:hypothetical protein [Staphylothermus marinus]
MNPWKNMPVHRIFTFVEHGLLPGIVGEFFDLAWEIGCSLIVDPFIGGGVVAVEGISRGFNIVGLDVNPWSLIVTKAKTLRLKEPRKILDRFLGMLENVGKPYIPTRRLEKYYVPEHLEKIGLIRAVIENINDDLRLLLLTVLGRIADEYSFLKRTPAPRFKGNPPRGDPVKRYVEILEVALKDLSNAKPRGSAMLLLADSTEWLPEHICGLLTSPPFANNIDYIRHTQLQLLWSGFAVNSRDLGYWRNLQLPGCEAASRAWKKTSNDEVINQLINNMAPKYRKRYGRFLKQYFYYMQKHINLLAESLEGIAWYTIGDSYLGGVYVPTHLFLQRYAEKSGLKTKIRRIKDRYSRSKRLALYLLEIMNKR